MYELLKGKERKGKILIEGLQEQLPACQASQVQNSGAIFIMFPSPRVGCWWGYDDGYVTDTVWLPDTSFFVKVQSLNSGFALGSAPRQSSYDASEVQGESMLEPVGFPTKESLRTLVAALQCGTQ